MDFTEHTAVSKLLILLIWYKLMDLTITHASLTGWKSGRKAYGPKTLRWKHLFAFHTRRQNVLYHEIRISLSTAQVTSTGRTQGTCSFPVSAIISEQAVDLILHEEGKTNIQWLRCKLAASFWKSNDCRLSLVLFNKLSISWLHYKVGVAVCLLVSAGSACRSKQSWSIPIIVRVLPLQCFSEWGFCTITLHIE